MGLVITVPEFAVEDLFLDQNFNFDILGSLLLLVISSIFVLLESLMLLV
ncbi:14365_t:CDS:2 [Entrophospora sp. SA101]|nr:14365_t:CDS:2 [Entrophospora sp. SA101]